MLLPRGPGSVDATYLRYLQVLARVGPMGHFSLEILDPIATLSLSHGYKLVEPDIQHRGGGRKDLHEVTSCLRTCHSRHRHPA